MSQPNTTSVAAYITNLGTQPAVEISPPDGYGASVVLQYLGLDGTAGMYTWWLVVGRTKLEKFSALCPSTKGQRIRIDVPPDVALSSQYLQDLLRANSGGLPPGTPTVGGSGGT